MNAVVKNFLLLFVLTAVLLVISEISARLILRTRTPAGMIFDETLIYSFQPNSKVGELVLNDIACIGPDMLAPKKPGERRVLLLGGSTSFANPYVRVVTEYLQERNPNNVIKVVSCGRPRYTSYSNRVNFDRNLKDLSFDVVALYLGINDNIYNTFSWVSESPDIGYFDWRSTKELLAIKMLKYYILDKQIRSQPNFKPSDIRSDAILSSNVEDIIANARASGSKVVLSDFAISYPTKDATLAAKIQQDEAIMQHVWGKVQSTTAGVKRHNEVVAELSAKHHLGFVKVSDTIPHDSEHFIDLCHLTESGYDILGKAIAQGVLKALRGD